MSLRHVHYSAVFAFVLLTGVVLGAANLVLGDLNQDEGWYLYAARLVADGWLPYRDFAFTQGPVMPVVYALFNPVVDAFGVGGGRAVTWLFGFASAVLSAMIARMLGGRAAGALALALLLLNVYHGYFTTVVKTYSLCAFFIVLGFYALSRSVLKVRPVWMLLAGVCFALAAGTRLSAGVLLPVTGLWLLFSRRRWGAWSWCWFGAGGGAALMIIFTPFYVAAPEGFTFGLIEFHTLREAGGAMAAMVYKAGFVSRMVQAYFVAAALVVIMLAAKVWRPFAGTDTGYHETNAFNLVRLMGVSALAMTAVHLTAPFPYDDYQVPVFPLVAVVLAVSWAFAVRAWSGAGYRWEAGVEPQDPALTPWLVWAVALVCAGASFASPVNQEWMIAGRDRIWWITKDQPSLLKLRDVARDVKARADDGLLLTQDTYLAVEAGLTVPMGWEMGPFSYYPDMPTERAEALRLVNKEKLLHDIATSPARIAAISGYGLAISSPEVAPLDADHRQELLDMLTRRYALTDEISGFGQASTTLQLYRLKRSP